MAAFVVLAMGASVGFVCNLLWTRLLGASGTGAIFMGVTIVAIGATLGRAGIDNVVMREASIRLRDGDIAAIRTLHRRSCSTVLGLGSAIAVAIWLASPWLPISESIRAELGAALPVLLIGLPASALLVLQGEFLKACAAPVLGTFLQVALLPALVVFGLLGMTLVNGATVATAAWAQTAATLIAAAIATIVWRKMNPWTGASGTDWHSGQLLRAGAPFLWVAGMNLIMTWTDVIVLGAWSDSATLGIYGVAARITALMTFILTAANSVTAPHFAALASRADQRQLQSVAQTSTFWMTAAAAPVTLVLMIRPELVLDLFGRDFTTGATSLRILAAGQFVNVALGSVGFLLMMTGHERVLRNVILVAATANLAGNLAFVPIFGAEGAAAATALSVILLNVAAYWQVRRRLRIDTLGYLTKLLPACIR